MRTPVGEMPFDPAPAGIGKFVHVEAERERVHGDLVANDHVPLVALHHLGRRDARVVPRVPAIIDDNAPHLLGSGPHDRDRGAAERRVARARRQLMRHDHIARGEAATHIL